MGAVLAYDLGDRSETAKTAVGHAGADSTLLSYGSPFDFRNPFAATSARDRGQYLRRDLVV